MRRLSIGKWTGHFKLLTRKHLHFENKVAFDDVNFSSVPWSHSTDNTTLYVSGQTLIYWIQSDLVSEQACYPTNAFPALSKVAFYSSYNFNGSSFQNIAHYPPWQPNCQVYYVDRLLNGNTTWTTFNLKSHTNESPPRATAIYDQFGWSPERVKFYLFQDDVGYLSE